MHFIGESCVVISGASVCSCKVGYVGSRCQLNDPCVLKPCNGNGACFPILQTVIVSGNSIEQVSSYCQCYSGFSGANCQIGKIANALKNIAFNM